MDNHLHFTNYETEGHGAKGGRRRRCHVCPASALPASRQFANHDCRCSGGGRGGPRGRGKEGRAFQGHGGRGEVPRPPRASGGRRGGIMTASLAKALAGKFLEAAEGVISSSSRRPGLPRHLQALAGRGRRRRLQVRVPRGGSRAPPQRAARSRSQNEPSGGSAGRKADETAGTRPAALGGVSGDSGGKQGPQTHLKRIGLKTFIGQDFVGLQRR